MHVHSVHSDGTCTVGEIVKCARKKGISVLALTDHDTLSGWGEFRSCCAEYGVRPLSGVELSSKYDRTVHILGYRIERFEPLNDALEWVRARRNDRNEMIAARLRDLGLPITMEEVAEHAGGQVIARPHFARALVAKGYAKDYSGAFERYLARGASAYVSREALTPSDCVAAIKRSGGLPVLAHPSLTGLDEEGLGALILSLKPHGLWGMECISSHCSSGQALEYLAIAEKYSLYPTAGSDFHGSVRPNAALGVQVTDDFLPWARLGINF